MKLHQPLECLSKDKDKDRSRSRRGHRRDAVRSTKRARFAAVLVRDGYVSITVYSMWNIIIHASFYKSTIQLLLTMYVSTKGLITIPF